MGVQWKALNTALQKTKGEESDRCLMQKEGTCT